MSPDQELGVSDEVAGVIDQQPESIKAVVRVSTRPGWSSTFTGSRPKGQLHIRLLRTVRDDAFHAQQQVLKGVIKYIALRELPVPLSTGEKFIAIRELQERTLAKALPAIHRAESPQALNLRTVVLRNVISGISSLHSVKAVHGDIKPDNIAISKDVSRVELMDFGSPMPQGQLHDDEVAYRGPGTAGSFANDIFAFGTLIHDLGHDLRLSVVLDQIGLTARQLLWLSEVARWETARDRPDADTLLAVLFDREAFWLTASEHVKDAGNDLLRMLNRHNSNLVSLNHLHGVKQLVTRNAIRAFCDHPETMVYAQRSKRLVSLLANIPVDADIGMSHNQAHEDSSSMLGEHVTVIEASIDDDFRGLIERDLRRNYAGLESAEFQDELGEATRFFDEFRRQLMSEAKYYDDHGLSQLMSRPDEIHVTPAEVGILRQWGILIGVPDHNRWLYPDFQFDPEESAPYSIIQEVSDRFVSDENPWAVLSWWLSPHPRLGGRTPAEILPDRELRNTLPSLVASAI